MFTYSDLFMANIPEQPANPGPFKIQHGYADIKIHTEKYNDEPTPLAGKQGKAMEFMNDQFDKDHQKKYAKEGAKRGFNMLLQFLCH